MKYSFEIHFRLTKKFCEILLSGNFFHVFLSRIVFLLVSSIKSLMNDLEQVAIPVWYELGRELSRSTLDPW